MTPPSVDPGRSFCSGGLPRGRARVPAVSHQTVKLTSGSHRSPREGVCVMELASMLAGEPFSDHPASVSPVIGSFLRAYNDEIDDDRRQDLYEYASRVVGSRASKAVERARAERLAAWAMERQQRPWRRLLVRPVLHWLQLARLQPFHTPGAEAVCAIGRPTEETHAQALALIDELLTLDPGEPPPYAAGAATAPGGTGEAASGCGADVRASSDRERASIALLRERHTVT